MEPELHPCISGSFCCGGAVNQFLSQTGLCECVRCSFQYDCLFSCCCLSHSSVSVASRLHLYYIPGFDENKKLARTASFPE